MVRGVVIALGILVAGTAAAESRVWTVAEANAFTGKTSASICPYENPEAGQHNCLSLECVPGEALTLSASVAGFDDPEDIGLEITVDGDPLWDLRLKKQEDGRYSRAITRQRFSEGVDRLQAGASGTLTFFTDQFLWRDHLPLKGSRAAIDAVLSACWRASVAPETDPAAAAREEVRSYCRDVHGREAVLNEGFLTEADYDGDGKTDLRVNYGAANCGPIGSAWCGWAGCEQAIHLSRADGFIRAFRGITEGIEIVPGGVVMRRHASDCAPDRDAPCALRYRATAEGFVKAGEADWPTR